jgi:hypothetical protein
VTANHGTLRVAAFQEGIGALLKVDLFLSHFDGEPVIALLQCAPQAVVAAMNRLGLLTATRELLVERVG